MMSWQCLIAVVVSGLAAVSSYAYSATDIIVGNFSQQSLSGWQEKEFAGKTRYQFVVQEQGRSVLEAISNKSASGLFKKVHIDLNKTPFLNWSWKIDNPLKGLNERTKEGDDYSARVYVVKSYPVFFWKTMALNYVWSSSQSQLPQWDNAYTSQAKMLAVRGKDSTVQHWYTEKRNLKQDFKKFFGEDVAEIDVVAVMTDTDNSKQATSAWYGNIYFSAD